MDNRKVVITGMGMLNPLGASMVSSWEGLTAGKSGIGAIDSFDTTGFPVSIGGAVPAFDITEYLSKKDSRRMDGFIHYGLAAGMQAMQDSGLEVTDLNRHRMGVVVGSGIGGIESIETCHDIVVRRGPTKVTPFYVPSCVINMVAGHLSIQFGLQGPNIAITTACTTGTHNIGFAARMIAAGDADVMLAGGVEKSISITTMAGFAAMKALSMRNSEPELASRPFDKARDGFVLSDGAAVLVLEEYTHARARGANIYCELIGFGMSADASHITSPADKGAGALRAMQNALADASTDASEVDYINAHGTSTPLGDIAETIAIKSLMGAAANKVAVGSSKSMTGHMLGAAGAVEAVITALSIKHQVATPTINLDNPDAQCDLDYIPHFARDMPIRIAISNSFGFGGTNGSLVFKQID